MRQGVTFEHGVNEASLSIESGVPLAELWAEMRAVDGAALRTQVERDYWLGFRDRLREEEQKRSDRPAAFIVEEVLGDMNRGAESPAYAVRVPFGWTLASYRPEVGDVLRTLECVHAWFKTPGEAAAWWDGGGHDD